MKKIQIIHDVSADAALEIQAYQHCGRCLDEWKAKFSTRMSPAEYSRTQAGIPSAVIQIWCNRHNCNVTHMKIKLAPRKAKQTEKIV